MREASKPRGFWRDRWPARVDRSWLTAGPGLRSSPGEDSKAAEEGQ